MKSLRIAASLCFFSVLGGCAVYTPQPVVVVDPVPPMVVVTPAVTHVPAGRGGFCPPGQAKKGNC